MKKFLFLVTMFLVTSMGVDAQILKNQEVKYQGEVDLSYSIGTGIFSTGRVNIHTIHGAKIGNHFSAGFGLGVDFYHELEDVTIPVYLNAKGYLPVGEKLNLYASLDLGYGVFVSEGLGGFLWSPAIGINYKKLKFQIGYTSQRVSESGIGFDMNALQFKIGLMF